MSTSPCLPCGRERSGADGFRARKVESKELVCAKENNNNNNEMKINPLRMGKWVKLTGNGRGRMRRCRAFGSDFRDCGRDEMAPYLVALSDFASVRIQFHQVGQSALLGILIGRRQITARQSTNGSAVRAKDSKLFNVLSILQCQKRSAWTLKPAFLNLKKKKTKKNKKTKKTEQNSAQFS